MNLASRCGELGRLDEGIRAAQAAVIDLRAFTAQHQARYERDLASALIVLGYLLIESHDITAGARLLTEALQTSLTRDLDKPLGQAISGLRAAYRTAPDEVAATCSPPQACPSPTCFHPIAIDDPGAGDPLRRRFHTRL